MVNQEGKQWNNFALFAEVSVRTLTCLDKLQSMTYQKDLSLGSQLTDLSLAVSMELSYFGINGRLEIVALHAAMPLAFHISKGLFLFCYMLLDKTGTNLHLVLKRKYSTSHALRNFMGLCKSMEV